MSLAHRGENPDAKNPKAARFPGVSARIFGARIPIDARLAMSD
jgi:hypothetical protein